MWIALIICVTFLGSGIWALWFGHKERTDSAKAFGFFALFAAIGFGCGAVKLAAG
ncbi:MAG: hypothetical protein AB7F35_01145 [Acetobacteraceae bacterium]